MPPEFNFQNFVVVEAHERLPSLIKSDEARRVLGKVLPDEERIHS
jgi:hypothetical protein